IPQEHVDMLRYEAALIGMSLRAAGQARAALSFAPPATKQRLELERRAPLLALMAFLLILMTGGAVYALQVMVEKQNQAVRYVQEIIRPGEEAGPELRKAREEQDHYLNRFT